jgi:hypothetical protein
MATKQREREERWKRLIQEQASSGQGVREFCHERGASVNGFYEWKRRLDQRSAAEPVRFALVETGAEKRAAAGLEIVLASGDRIVVPVGTDGERLRMVVAALREGR